VCSTYPFELSDQELEHALRQMLIDIPGFDRYDRLRAELKLTLILIGASERSRRDADRIGRRLFWIAVIALAVALISLFVSIILAV
jgi:hypothetical protein